MHYFVGKSILLDFLIDSYLRNHQYIRQRREQEG